MYSNKIVGQHTWATGKLLVVWERAHSLRDQKITQITEGIVILKLPVHVSVRLCDTQKLSEMKTDGGRKGWIFNNGKNALGKPAIKIWWILWAWPHNLECTTQQLVGFAYRFAFEQNHVSKRIYINAPMTRCSRDTRERRGVGKWCQRRVIHEDKKANKKQT